MTEAFAVVLTTVATKESAREIAKALLEERLCACVQLLNAESYFTWKSEPVAEEEILLVIKTKMELYERLEASILRMHTYETPEIVLVPITTGFSDYLDWIDRNIQGGAEPSS